MKWNFYMLSQLNSNGFIMQDELIFLLFYLHYQLYCSFWSTISIIYLTTMFESIVWNTIMNCYNIWKYINLAIMQFSHAHNNLKLDLHNVPIFLQWTCPMNYINSLQFIFLKLLHIYNHSTITITCFTNWIHPFFSIHQTHIFQLWT